MLARRVALRFLWPVLLTSLVLLTLCSVTAFTLYQRQSEFAEVFRENIESRRVAADLEESLVELAGLVRDRPDGLASLHKHIAAHLDEVDRYADRPRERELAAQVRASYDKYLRAWGALPPGADADFPAAVEQLEVAVEKEAVPQCAALRRYNAELMEEAANGHKRELQGLAVGMVFVGAAGAAAGVVLGYGASRALARSVRRMQIHVQDAAGKLGHTFPEIVLVQEGNLDTLQGQMETLAGQVERVVQTLQQREREVLRAEQLAAVGQLAAGVAHEIRNPLTSIKMLVQLGRAGGPGLLPDDLEVIEREVRRMERSLNTFLQFARPPKPVREPVEVRALVDHTLNLVRGRAAQQHVKVGFDRPGRPVEYVGDPEQLQQVLVNLALNALDAMPAGGSLDVKLGQKGDGRVEVAVADTGTGIAADLMPRLFQPFVSNKETGLGLGLVTSRRIVEDHGGTITAANRPEGGAVFTVRLAPGRMKDQG